MNAELAQVCDSTTIPSMALRTPALAPRVVDALNEARELIQCIHLVEQGLPRVVFLQHSDQLAHSLGLVDSQTL